MFAIVLAALDRSGSVLPILYAMGVHELAHVVMMLLAALAGPLVNLVCGALFCMRSPAFAAYSLMLGIYNLLPVWPLDGGRAVRCALAQHLPLARAEAVSRRSSFAVCAALLLAGIILTFFRRAGLWPLGTAAYLTLRLLTLAKRTGE